MCGGEKKKEKKKKKNILYVCVEDKKRGKEKDKKKKKEREMVLQYFHNTFTINLKCHFGHILWKYCGNIVPLWKWCFSQYFHKKKKKV